MSPVREAKPADRAEFQRLWLASLTEQHANGSDMLPTGRSVAFGLSYFDSYTRGSLFGVCLLWCPEGQPASPQGFVLGGERWSEDDYDRDVGRMAWVFSLYMAPELRRSGAGGALSDTFVRMLAEMGFDVMGFNIPTGGQCLPIATRLRAVPRGVWYTVPLKSPEGTNG